MHLLLCKILKISFLSFFKFVCLPLNAYDNKIFNNDGICETLVTIRENVDLHVKRSSC